VKVVLSEALKAIVEQIRGLEYAVGGPILVALFFVILAARARSSAQADFKTYDKIWQPAAPNLKEAPSPSDALIVGLRAFVRGSFQSALFVVFVFLAFDFFFVRGNLTLTLLVWLGL
jgi:hypothetical protein